ncbi:MAG TPA: ammonium transporter [Acidimicrobiales bacterium]|nr:ammonium transporter [Acidimicrobiales bacterium]
MSNGKKFILLAVLTFVALIVVGAMFSGKGGDTTGAHTGTTADVIASQGLTGDTVPPSQVGINAVANEAGHLHVAVNFSWLLMTGYLVLFMQVGFAFLVTGLTRAKNAAHMMMMNVAAFAIALVAYYAVGFAFHFGGVGAIANLGGTSPLNGLFPHGNSGLIGWHGFFLQSSHGYDVGVIGLFLFQVVFMETAGYIIIGAIAERISFAGFIVAELAMGAIIYPIYGNWLWGGGWMAHLGQTLHWGHGAVDFAGSGVVHATGGWAALALAMVLGPRIGKFNADGTPNAFPGHNIGYVVIGTMILLFGWMGFNPGSTLGATDLRISIVAVNTLLSACFGFIAAMCYTNARYGKPDISMSCNGMLAGLVAITAPCAFVAPWAASIIGIVAGLLVCWGVYFFDHVAHVDDPCGAISVHGINGAWGVLALGIFADGTYGSGWNGIGGNVKGLLYGDPGQFMAQVAHVVVGFVWAWGVTWLIFSGAKKIMAVRVSPEVELQGLDMPEFGTVCYPDFQLVSHPDHVTSGMHAASHPTAHSGTTDGGTA